MVVSYKMHILQLTPLYLFTVNKNLQLIPSRHLRWFYIKNGKNFQNIFLIFLGTLMYEESDKQYCFSKIKIIKCAHLAFKYTY